MTLVYSNKRFRHTLYIDRMDEMTTLTLDSMVQEKVDEYDPAWYQAMFDDPSAGILLSYEDADRTIAMHSIILRIAEEYFRKAGLDIGENNQNATIQFWKWHFDDEKDVFPNSFSLQCGNDNADDNSHVCIFMTRKHEQVEGCNLLIHPDMSEQYVLGLFGMGEEPLELPIDVGNVILMDGNLYHDISPGKGSGDFYMLVVNLTAH